MQLSPDQVERFYAIWKPLILFINHRRQLQTAGLKESQRKQSRTGLTRFCHFLRDTGRMDYDMASAMLDVLQERE